MLSRTEGRGRLGRILFLDQVGWLGLSIRTGTPDSGQGKSAPASNHGSSVLRDGKCRLYTNFYTFIHLREMHIAPCQRG